jgi:hypothetical protein
MHGALNVKNKCYFFWGGGVLMLHIDAEFNRRIVNPITLEKKMR